MKKKIKKFGTHFKNKKNCCKFIESKKNDFLNSFLFFNGLYFTVIDNILIVINFIILIILKKKQIALKKNKNK